MLFDVIKEKTSKFLGATWKWKRPIKSPHKYVHMVLYFITSLGKFMKVVTPWVQLISEDWALIRSRNAL